MTVDGTHCPIWEPKPFSTQWSSHKYGGKPAVNYELGIRVHKPQLAWVYGPTRPGAMNDLEVSKQALLPELKRLKDIYNQPRRIIGDGIYSSEPEFISNKNSFDPKELSIFKQRALARHERFNGLLKNFGVLHHIFRHGRGNVEDVHRYHFHACCELVQIQLNLGVYTLFDSYP